MHYAFDAWLANTQPTVRFERYCDDAIVHCGSEKQAEYIRSVIAARLGQFGLRLHPEKTKVVYCAQEGRTQRRRGVEFTFLGYDFRPRSVRTGDGSWKTGFLPAVSKAAKKHMATVIRGWRLGRRTGLSFGEIATMINRVVAGWINYCVSRGHARSDRRMVGLRFPPNSGQVFKQLSLRLSGTARSKRD